MERKKAAPSKKNLKIPSWLRAHAYAPARRLLWLARVTRLHSKGVIFAKEPVELLAAQRNGRTRVCVGLTLRLTLRFNKKGMISTCNAPSFAPGGFCSYLPRNRLVPHLRLISEQRGPNVCGRIANRSVKRCAAHLSYRILIHKQT